MKVANLHGTIEKSINVISTPTVLKDIEPQQVTVRTGMGSFRLEVLMSGGIVQWYKDGKHLACAAAGCQTGWGPEYHYYIDGERTRGNFQFLVVRDVMFEDAGTYVAKIQSEAGECVSSPCLVTVVQGPAPGVVYSGHTRGVHM